MPSCETVDHASSRRRSIVSRGGGGIAVLTLCTFCSSTLFIGPVYHTAPPRPLLPTVLRETCHHYQRRDICCLVASQLTMTLDVIAEC